MFLLIQIWPNLCSLLLGIKVKKDSRPKPGTTFDKMSQIWREKFDNHAENKRCAMVANINGILMLIDRSTPKYQNPRDRKWYWCIFSWENHTFSNINIANVVKTGYMQLSDDQSADKTTKSANPYYIQTLGKKIRVSRFLTRIGNKRASPKRNGIFMWNIKHKAQCHWVQNTRDKAVIDPTVIHSGVHVHATDETALDIDNWQVRTKYGQSLWGFDVW